MSTTNYIVMIIALEVAGHFFVLFLPSRLQVVYVVLGYPVMWVVGGYLIYRSVQSHKEKDLF